MGVPVVRSVNHRLKQLRLSAVPSLSIRAMAEALDIGYSRYAYFEDPKRFKKSAIPMDLARKIADVLVSHGVDPAEVLQLAGLSSAEAEPEAKSIETNRPASHFAMLRVELPSEDALAAMFEGLLAIVPPDATRSEAARILARRLPIGFQAIGPAVHAQPMTSEIADVEALRSQGTDDLGAVRQSRT